MIEKTRHIKAFRQTKMLLVILTIMVFMLSLSNVNAWSTNAFNNSLASENISMSDVSSNYDELNNFLLTTPNSTIYYKFDETSSNIINHIGINTYDTSIRAGRNGYISDFSINGSSLYINGSTGTNIVNTKLIDTGTFPITTSVWVYYNKTNANANHKIIWSDNGDWGYDLTVTSGILTFHNGFGSINTGFNMTDKGWVHITYLLNSTSAQLYINGTLRNSTVGRLESGTNFTIGSHISASGNNFNGYIDELILFKRDLTKTEIEEIYNFYSKEFKEIRYLLVPQNTFLTNAYMNLSFLPFLYQETADSYEFTGNGNWSGYPSNINIIDGNWSTSSSADFNFNYLLVNYTKPPTTSSANITYKFENTIYNTALPQTCFNNGLNYISIKYFDYYNLPSCAGGEISCWNGTDYQFLNYDSDRCPGNPDFYEEGIYWFINNNNDDLSNLNITINNNQVYYYPGNFTHNNNRTDNFANIINNYLSTCSIINEFCNVPIQFTSTSSGILQYSDLIFNKFDYVFNNLSYTSSVLETQNSEFILNISYDSNFYTTATAILNYKGSNYTTTPTYSLNNVVFKTNMSAPLGAGNNSFYWIIQLTNSSGVNNYQTQTYNQTVRSISPMIINTTCPAGYNITMRFIGNEELNLSNTSLNNIEYLINYTIGGIGVLSYEILTNVNQMLICVNATQYPTWEILDGEIFYKKTNYADRRYYIFSGTKLTTTTQNVSLHVLPSTIGQSFELTVEDRSLNVYKNKYISLIRWYPGTNEYRVVDIGKTDEYGKTIINVETENADYRIGVYEKNGQLIYLSSPVRMICLTVPCSYNLKVSLQEYDYTALLKIQKKLIYNVTDGIWRFTYNDPSQTTSLINMTIYLDSGLSRIAICSTTQTGSTGSLVCNTSNAQYGTQIAIVERSASPPVILDQKSWRFTNSIFSGDTFGLFMIWLIMIPVIFIFGLYSPVASLFGAVIALIPAYYLGSINLGILTGIIALSAIVVHFLRRV